MEPRLNLRATQWIWNNAKTVGKHVEVVEKPLYKCISEGLIHVAAWYHGNPGPKFTKFGESIDWSEP